MCGCAGSGGGAGYVGGPGSPFFTTQASAGTSFLDTSVNGKCTGLTGNGNGGYVTVQMQ